jgi:hypothetical protein
MLREIENRRLLRTKAFLFLIVGAIAVVLLMLEQPTFRTAALLGLVIWSFCRAYYFAFYVIEKYADPTFRYAGLWSLARSIVGRRQS